MAITDILLRELTDPDLVTKGSELTNPEGDANWIAIKNAIKALMVVSGIAPFNPITAYSGTIYVSYGGNLWVHIGGGTDTGVTPGSNPAIWQITSLGLLWHQQNTDTSLAFGTPDYVTATALWGIINEQVITITVAQLVTRAAAGTLIPNRLYYLEASGKYLIRSITPSTYSQEAHVLASVPDIANYPQYDYAGSYSPDDRVYFSGTIFKALTGVNAGTPPDTDPTNWIDEAPYTAPYYLTKLMSCRINIGAGYAITCYEMRDEFGNTFQSPSFQGASIQYANKACMFSVLSAWNYRGNMFGNDLKVSTMTLAEELSASGNINYNVLNNAILTIGAPYTGGVERLLGTFSNNYIEGADVRFIKGLDSGKYLTNVIIKRKKGTILQLPKTIQVDGGYLDDRGGDIAINIGAPSAGVIDLTALATAGLDIFGVYEVNGGTLSTLTNFFPKHRIKIRPLAGSTTITVTTKNETDPIASDEFAYDSTPLVLNEATSDYIIIEQKIMGVSPFRYYKVVEVNIAS